VTVLEQGDGKQRVCAFVVFIETDSNRRTESRRFKVNPLNVLKELKRLNCPLRSPPNMTRVLTRWGLQPYLSKFAQRCTQFSFMQGSTFGLVGLIHVYGLAGETGEQIGLMKLHEELLRDLLADFMFIQVRMFVQAVLPTYIDRSQSLTLAWRSSVDTIRPCSPRRCRTPVQL